MGRSKNNKNKNDGPKLGLVRKETREEKRQRILAEARAREQCMDILPQSLMIVFILTLLFYAWARSVPLAEPAQQRQAMPNVNPSTTTYPSISNPANTDKNKINKNYDDDRIMKSKVPKVSPTKIGELDEELIEL